MYEYPIKVEADGETFLVTSKDFPELTTFGETRDDAMMRAVDALEEAIAARIADNRDVPEPSPRGRTRVALPLRTTLTVLIYRAMREQGVKKAEMARRLGWHGPQVDRILNVRHSSKVEQVDMALAALGKRVVAELRDA